MKTPNLHRAVIFGTCIWLAWAAPSEARFLQVDPVGYRDQTNLYAYVGNDPANFADPSGTIMLPPENMNPNRDWSSRQGRAVAEAAERGPPAEAAGAARDFGRNYQNMRNANTIGADKYFHCRANCEASSRGETGRQVAEQISNAREIVDHRIGGDPPQASQQDQRANVAGRNAGDAIRRSTPLKGEAPNASRRPQAENQCRARCGPFRPRGLDREY